ncbi:MAG: hypothetical protein CL695_05810, partial [Chloroflexi bacterium]|nr:hypothetical protein [Chloroflexota bacterium]
TAVDTLNIQIENINDAPVLEEIGDRETDEDIPLVITLSAEDVDGDNLTFTVESDDESVAVSLFNGQLTMTPALNFNGVVAITITVNDTQGTSDSETFNLYVNAVNDAPVSQDLYISTSEDTPIVVPVSGSDVEGASLTFEVVDSPQHGGLGPSFVVSIDAAEGGEVHSLDLGFLPFASDGYDDGIDIYAPPAPPPPAFDAALNWNGDRYYRQMLSGSPDDIVEHIWDIQLQYGVDGEILLSWDSSGLDSLGSFILEDAFGGAMISVDMSTQSELLLDNPAFTTLKVRVTPAGFFEWVYTPEPEYMGEEDFTYRAFDGELYSQPSMVNIEVPPMNDPPVLSYIGSRETDEDVPLSIGISGTDPDQGTNLIFTAESDTSAVETDIQDGILTLTSELNWHGISMITVEVSDGFITDSETFELTVSPVNDFPEIDLPDFPESVSFEEDDSLTVDFSVYVSDVDGDELFLESSSSQNLFINMNGLVVTFTTARNFNGSESVTFTVYDGQGEFSSASDELLVNVAPVNDAPVLEEIGDQQTDENQILLLDILVSDVEGDEITIDAESDTSAVEAKMVQDQLKLTPELNWNGTAEITVTVNDGFLFTSETFTLTVMAVNNLPVAENLRIDTNEDESVEVDFEGSDIDGDELTFEVVDEPLHGSLSEGVYTPDPDYNGGDMFTYRAFDGTGYSDPADVVVTVFPVNDAPVLSEIGDQVIDEDEVLEYTLTAEDVDGDALVYDASSLSEDIEVKVTGDLLTVTPDANWNGSADIMVTVSDGFLSDDEVFTLTVNPVNDAPVAEEVAIFPSVPLESHDLELSYIYTDIEGDPESGTEITWYKDGVEQMEFANQLTIPASATLCDEVWHATVTPSDGMDVGELAQSNSVTICGDNSPPVWLSIPDQHINEDDVDSLSMEGLVIDGEQALSQMQFTVTSNSDNENLGADFSRSMLHLTSLTEDYYSLSPIMLTLTVNDGEYTVETTMNVYIDPVNDAPVLGEIGSQITDEDIPLSFILAADDIDGDELNFNAFSEYPDFVSVFLVGNELTLTPAEDFFGDVQINVSVTDGEYTDTDVFTLIVLPINDAPTINLPVSVTFDEDGSYTEDFSVYIDDIDEDGLSLSVTGGVNVLVEINGFIVNFSSNDDWNGTEILTFMVDDAQGRAVATDDIDVIVTPVNDAPILASIADDSTAEEIPLVLMLEAVDVDEDPLTFDALSSTPSDVNVDVSGNILTMTPAENFNGDVQISVSVTDGEYTDNTVFTLTVTPVNDAPVIELPDSFTFEEDGVLLEDFSVYIDDIDEDELVLTVAGMVNITVSIDDFDVTFGSVQDFNGTETLIFTVNDNQGRAIASDDVDVIVIPVNDAPVLDSLGVQFTDEDTPLTITLSGSDVDEDNLTFSAVSEYPGFVSAEVAGNQLTLTPSEDFNGSVNISITVNDSASNEDGDELTDSEVFELIVTPVNDAPVMAEISDMSMAEDTQSAIILSASDVDDGTGEGDENALSYNAISSNDDDVSVTVDGDQLTMTPSLDFHGDVIITVTVTDDGGLSDDTDFVLTITPVSDAPVMALIGPQDTAEEVPLTITVSSSDVDTGTGDGDENIPEYSCSSSDSLSVVCSVSGDQVTMDPAQDFHGLVLITVTVTDDGGLSDDTDFVLTVDPVNDAPVIEDIASQDMDEDTTLDITLIAFDVDNGTGVGDENDLSFSAESDNASISVSVTGDELTIAPNADYYGSGTITVMVTDMGNRLTDETSFDVTVNNVNDAPVITLIGGQETIEEVEITRAVEFSDADIHDPSDTHTITVESSSPSDVSVENLSGNVSESTYDLVPSIDFHGDVTITVTVTDNGTGNLSDINIYTFTVHPVNDAPVMTLIDAQDTAEDTPLTITVSSSDVDTGTGDGDENVPEYSCLSSDSLSVVCSISGDQLNMEPALNFNGDVTITVTVTDNGGLSDDTDFVLTVVPVNDVPVIVGQIELTTNEETSITVIFSDLLVEDVDNDYPEYFILTVLDSGDYSEYYSVDGTTIIPVLDFDGILIAPVYINDGEDENSESDIFYLEINVINVNDAPILGLIGNQDTQEDTPLVLTLEATDVDNDSTDLTFSVFTDNENVTAFIEDGLLTMTPDPDYFGIASITVTVTDGDLEDLEIFELVVNSVNDGPELVEVDDDIIDEDTQLTLALFASDVED